MVKAKKTMAMVVRRPKLDALMGSALTGLARAISKAVTPATVAPLYDEVDSWITALEDSKAALRSRILDILETHGETTTEKGCRVAELNGWHFEARPQKTGPDSKKVEALLRAKGLSPQTWMDTEVKYSANPEKLARAIGEGVLSEAEVQTCNHELKWAVIIPKKVNTDNE